MNITDMLSKRQGTAIIIMFIFGSSVILGVGNDLGPDSWLGAILAMLLFIPVLFLYSNILKQYPEKDFFEIIEIALGKIWGKIIIALYLWYAMHLGSLIIRNFTEFVKISAMPETPQLPLMICMLIISIHIAKSGISTFGKWASLTFIIVMIIVLFTFFASIPQYNIENVMPFLNNPINKIAFSSFKIFSFPFAEIVLFLPISSYIKKENILKIMLTGILISAAILILIIFRNTLILGELNKIEYFPSYTAAKTINIGEFFERIEGLISFNFILAGVTKLSVCLIAASKAITKLFDLNDYKKMVIPVSMLLLALCAIIYRNIFEMFDFINYYPIYAFPFQIIIPLIIWAAAKRSAVRKSIA